MITINASLTWPQENIDAFADALGYTEQVPNPAFESTLDPETGVTTDNGESPTIPNPLSKTDFVKEAFKKMASGWFAQFVERDARAQAEASAKEAIEGFKTQIESAITID